MPKAKVNEININYKVEGHGEPLVMIMGFAGDRHLWLFQTRTFKKYYQVITFDNRGVGKTDKPDGPYTMKMMADDTVGLMEYLGIDIAHILGHSMGGMIAQELAINYPHKVRKLVLGSTNPNGRAAIDEMTSNFPPKSRKAMESVGVSNASNRTALIALSSRALNNNEWLWKMLAPLQAWVLFIRGRTGGILGQYEAHLTHDTLDRLNMIVAPTLVITGTADRLISPHYSDVIASQIPNSKLVKIENGSHLCNIEMRGRFNKEVLEFLSSS